MMRPYTSGGYLLHPYPSKEELRAQYAIERNKLPVEILNAKGRYIPDYEYPIEYTPRTLQLKNQVIKETEEREIDPYMDELRKYVTEEELQLVNGGK